MRRLLFWLYVCAASAILLEVVMQVGALVVWMTHDPDDGTVGIDASAGTRVLCVGDSFTFGMGATSPARGSYPAVLERVLRDRHGVDAAVVNHGVPGRNSREVLANIAGQLGQTEPDYVCILIGANDSWSRPELLEVDTSSIDAARASTGATGSGGFPIRWRTKRLIEWLFRGGGGQWHGGETPEPADGGRGADPDGPGADPDGPGADSDGPRAGHAGGTDKPPAPLVETAPPPPRVDPPPRADGGAPQDPASVVREARGHVQNGRHQQAIAMLETALEGEPPDAADLYGVLVLAYLGAGRTEDAVGVVDALEQMLEKTPTDRVVRNLMSAVNRVGARDRALALANRLKDDHPDVIELWWALGRFSLTNGDNATAEVGFDRCLLLAERAAQAGRPLAAGWHASMMRKCGRVCAERDPQKALGLLMQSLLLDGALGPTRLDLHVASRHIPQQVAVDYVAARSEQLTDAQKASVARLLEQVYGDETNEHIAVLENHLGQMVAICRAAGAVPVILTYPFTGRPELAAAQRRAAERSGAPLVEVRARFVEELRTRRREEVYVGDGHCNDAGYRIVAEVVAEVIAAGHRGR